MNGHKTNTHTDDPEQGSPQTLGIDGRHYEKPNVPPSPYHDNIIRPALQDRPWLETLDQFMESTTPGFGVDLDYRMNHFDMEVIHISISGMVESIIHCDTPGKFYQAISEEQERSGTLVILKDISRAMIEILGTQYDLEPEFFATYLVGTETFRMGRWGCSMMEPPPCTPNLLPDCLRRASFYTGEFRRPYDIGGGRKVIDQLRKRGTCTPRGVNILSDELSEVFAAEKISVYKKPSSKTGIILTDRLLSTVPPASYMRKPVTSLNSITGFMTFTTRNVQISSRCALISWVQSLLPAERQALFANDDEPLALQPILKLTESTAAMFLIHARHTMARILMRATDTAFPHSVSFFLHVFRSLQYHVHEQRRLLRQAQLLVSHRKGEGLPGMREQIEDLKELREDLKMALEALEEHVKFLVATAQIQEGRVVGWVSKFAALFLPVSLLATILAISDPGYTRWAILGGLSVPFVVASVYFMFFWKPKWLESDVF